MEVIKNIAILILLFILLLLYVIVPVTWVTNWLERRYDIDYFITAWIVAASWVGINCIMTIIVINWIDKL